MIRRSFSDVRFERSPKRVRVLFGGRFIADSTRAHLLFEPTRLPVYYFPRDDVASDALERSDRTRESELGARRMWRVRTGERQADDAAWSFEKEGSPVPRNFVAFRWDAMDAWFEEDEEVFVHARDPYHRIDVLHSSRHVRVEHGGVELANSDRPVLLFETGLPTRFYLPRTDLRFDIVEPSMTRTACPYKGEADHWSARIDGIVHEDLAWTYRLPKAEVAKIENLVCFYQERVDTFEVDGKRVTVGPTPWSR